MQRDLEQLRHHFEVERELAERIRKADREERKKLYPTLYSELFERIPDHPRLTLQETDEQIRQAVEQRMRLLRPHLRERVGAFLEVAPGDCRLAIEMCQHAEWVVAADISDQTMNPEILPVNFEHLVYDGFELPVPAETIDLAFSYQFIEHLHPDDVDEHFRMMATVLKPGARYVFDTPHRFSGPHDVSGHFVDEPAGFHLKEWTYREMIAMLRRNGFDYWQCYRRGRPRSSAWVAVATVLGERCLELLPRALQRSLSRRLYRSVTMVAFRS